MLNTNTNTPSISRSNSVDVAVRCGATDQRLAFSVLQRRGATETLATGNYMIITCIAAYRLTGFPRKLLYAHCWIPTFPHNTTQEPIVLVCSCVLFLVQSTIQEAPKQKPVSIRVHGLSRHVCLILPCLVQSSLCLCDLSCAVLSFVFLGLFCFCVALLVLSCVVLCCLSYVFSCVVVCCLVLFCLVLSCVVISCVVSCCHVFCCVVLSWLGLFLLLSAVLY